MTQRDPDMRFLTFFFNKSALRCSNSFSGKKSNLRQKSAKTFAQQMLTVRWVRPSGLLASALSGPVKFVKSRGTQHPLIFLAGFRQFSARIQIFWRSTVTTTSPFTKLKRWWKNQKVDVLCSVAWSGTFLPGIAGLGNCTFCRCSIVLFIAVLKIATQSAITHNFWKVRQKLRTHNTIEKCGKSTIAQSHFWKDQQKVQLHNSTFQKSKNVLWAESDPDHQAPPRGVCVWGGGW